MEINKYLVQSSRSSHRLSLSHAGSFASQADDTSNAPTPHEQSLAPTPRQQSAAAAHNMFQDSPTASEASNANMSHRHLQLSPRAGHVHGGFAFSDRPILGGPEDLARSKSFTGHDQQSPSHPSVVTGREDSSNAMRRSACMPLRVQHIAQASYICMIDSVTTCCAHCLAVKLGCGSSAVHIWHRASTRQYQGTLYQD